MWANIRTQSVFFDCLNDWFKKKNHIRGKSLKEKTPKLWLIMVKMFVSVECVWFREEMGGQADNITWKKKNSCLIITNKYYRPGHCDLCLYLQRRPSVSWETHLNFNILSVFTVESRLCQEETTSAFSLRHLGIQVRYAATCNYVIKLDDEPYE